MRTFYLLLVLATCIASCTVETRVSSDDADTLTAEADGEAEPETIPPGSSGDTSVDDSRIPGSDLLQRSDSLQASDSDRPGENHLYPIDEADQDPSFFAYRMRLMDAVVRRDAEQLFEFISENIRASFGDDAGHDGFRNMWHPEAANSQLWETLGHVLSGGGTFMDAQYVSGDVEASFQAPYYFARFPGERFDAFRTGIIIADDVVVRAEPRQDASAVDTVGFEIVRVENFESIGDDDDRWIQVELDDEGSGYVPEAVIESPVGYRAIFQKQDGRWLMMAFVAGD